MLSFVYYVVFKHFIEIRSPVSLAAYDYCEWSFQSDRFQPFLLNINFICQA